MPFLWLLLLGSEGGGSQLLKGFLRLLFGVGILGLLYRAPELTGLKPNDIAIICIYLCLAIWAGGKRRRARQRRRDHWHAD